MTRYTSRPARVFRPSRRELGNSPVLIL
jgi:hypothetical protein